MGPQAMNDRGQVVGVIGADDLGEWQDGKLTDLGPGFPIAINNRGEILGSGINGDVTVWRNGMQDGTTHAFLWNGKMIDLGTFGGMSYPMAISNSDQVVGYSTDGKGKQSAFLWWGGTMDMLPAPKSDTGLPTRAVAIDDHNQIVGDDCQCRAMRAPGASGGPSKFVVLWKLTPLGVQMHRLLLRPHRS